jgi:predicted secreted hydrolase
MRPSHLLVWLLTVVLVCCACSPAGQPLAPAPVAPPVKVEPVTFPRDSGAHTNLMEWWYVTGHLHSELDRREYGFEFTIFQIYAQKEPSVYWLANFAITDVEGQGFSHQARFATVTPTPNVERLSLNVQGWAFSNEDGYDVIQARMAPGPGADPPFSVNLRLSDLKQPVLHHNGFIDFGPAGGSYYYSRPRVTVSGDLGRGEGQTEPVTGLAWMDHQWGDFVVVPSSGGWDWFSVQLDSGTELMLFILRNADGDALGVLGTRIEADGTASELPPGAVQIEATGEWTSPHTGANYPSGWRLHLSEPAMTLLVQPRLLDQELYFPGETDAMRAIAYWEGAVAVRLEDSDQQVGVGYVELTGYAR